MRRSCNQGWGVNGARGATRAYDSMGWMSQCYSDEVGCPLILDIGRLCLDSGKKFVNLGRIFCITISAHILLFV